LGISELTPPGLFYRVRHAERWLSNLLVGVLKTQVGTSPIGQRVVAVDATMLAGPGSATADWRVHVRFDSVSRRIAGIEVTDKYQGENLERHPFGPGDIVLGDRGYAHARGVAALVNSGAQVIVRFSPYSIRLCDQQGKVLALKNQANKLPPTGTRQWELLLPIPPPKETKSKKSWALSKAVAWLPVRVVAARTRNGGAIWVMTTLAAELVSDVDVLELYRLRWQVELAFKRLKSLLNLDKIPSRDGPTSRSWILARLLAAALAEKLLDRTSTLSPWGYKLR
jgi:IS4 transposase